MFGVPAPQRQDLELPLPAAADTVQCLDWNPQGNMVAAGGWDNKARLGGAIACARRSGARRSGARPPTGHGQPPPPPLHAAKTATPVTAAAAGGGAMHTHTTRAPARAPAAPRARPAPPPPQMRIWEVQRGMPVQPPTSAAGKAEMDFGGPLLDAEWRDDGMHLFGVGCNKTVKMWSLQSNAVQDIGSHDGPIKSCHWVKEKQFLVTTGWDKTIRYWDARSPSPQVRTRVGRRVDGCGAVAADGATRAWRAGVTGRPSWCARMTHAARPLCVQLTRTCDPPCPRAPPPPRHPVVAMMQFVLNLPERVHAVDVKYPCMVVATADKKFYVFNLDSPQKPFRVRRAASPPPPPLRHAPPARALLCGTHASPPRGVRPPPHPPRVCALRLCRK